MAENETLDLTDRHSRRWRRVLKRIESDEPAEQIADDTLRCVYKTFQNLAEMLPLHALFNAAKIGRDSVRELVPRCAEGRDYAELFAQQAEIHSDPASLVEGVARAIVDRFLDQIELRVVGKGHWPDMARFRILREDVTRLMRDGIARLARKVTDRPDEKPRMPRRSADRKEQDQRELLRLSLLPRSRTYG